MTDRWIVFVSDCDQLKRLECEPESVLSMEKSLHEVSIPNLVKFLYSNLENVVKLPTARVHRANLRPSASTARAQGP